MTSISKVVLFFSSFSNERGPFLWRAKLVVFFFTRPMYLAHSQQDILEPLCTAKRIKLFFFFFFFFWGAKLTKLSLFNLHFAGHVSHGIWLRYSSHFFSIVLLQFTRPQKIWHICLHSLIEMIECGTIYFQNSFIEWVLSIWYKITLK